MEKGNELRDVELWVLTEDRGMQLLDDSSETGATLRESVLNGTIQPGNDIHKMRIGSILVAAEQSFAFHPDELQA